MEFDETLLRERFDSGVADLTPDVVSLVGAGERSGQALLRRRRWQTGGSAVAAVVLVGGAFYATGDLLDYRAVGPADPSPTGSEQLVKATPRGMAAAVVDIIGLGDPVSIGGETSSHSQPSGDQIHVGAAYRVDGVRLSIEAVATIPVAQWQDNDSCATTQSGGGETVWCDDQPLADGTPALRVLMREADSQATGTADVTNVAIIAVKRDDQLVAVIETLPPGDGQTTYTESNLPVSFDALTTVVTDPRVGWSTTQEFVAAGEGIENFQDSLVLTSSDTSSSGEVQVAPPSTQTSK